jgi:hypothetical protein
MSSVRGRISVDVAFTDSTTVSGAQSLKTIVLRDATEYTSGKVAIVTGTAGTAGASISIPPTYRNADGSLSTLAAPSRVAFSATGGNLVRLSDANLLSLQSKSGAVSVSDMEPADDNLSIQVIGTAGTASYTLVLYGT